MHFLSREDCTVPSVLHTFHMTDLIAKAFICVRQQVRLAVCKLAWSGDT